MAEHLSIEECKAIQSKFALQDVHVVSLGDNGCAIAHTNQERGRMATVPLESCPLYRWLVDFDAPPHSDGVYVVIEHEPDLESEPYGADPWEFYTLQEWFGWDSPVNPVEDEG